MNRRAGLSLPLLSRRVGRRRFLTLAGVGSVGSVGLAFGACSGGEAKKAKSSGASEVARPPGWSDATHGRDVEPNYGLVFPAGKVNQLVLTVKPTDWAAMLANMVTILGPRGTGGGQPDQAAGPPQGGAQPQPGAGQPQPGGQFQPGGGGPPSRENPMWAPATVEFGGHAWTDVGLRFKGNSSLNGSWRSGTEKLPLKLDFDQFEGTVPAIKDQRLHGFKQLSLSNNFGDPSGLRETVAYNLFGAAGLVAAKTAPVEVILDHGEGRKSLGLYTAIEVIDDTVIRRSFKDATGNIYEADGRGATFARGTANDIKASFEVEGGSNPDWRDVEALYMALHDEKRATDAAAWRRGLQANLDVEGFLEWLALSAVIQHWDTYGATTHNFYLYNDPQKKRFTWISWDHNFVFNATPPSFGPNDPGGNAPQGGGPQGARRAPHRTVTFDRKEVLENWPLIRYLLDDATYYKRYTGFLREIDEKVFLPEKLEGTFAKWADLLAPHSNDEAALRTAVMGLAQTVAARRETLKSFVATL